MDKSSLKKLIKEELKKALNEQHMDFMGTDVDYESSTSGIDLPTAKKEIDIQFQQAQYLIDYQNGDMTWEEFREAVYNTQNQSMFANQIDWYMEWVDDQRTNDLPNRSSGSFLTALTDIDGLMSAFESIDEEFVEEYYDVLRDYSKDKYSQLRRLTNESLNEEVDHDKEIEKLEKEQDEVEGKFNKLTPKQEKGKWTPEATKLMKQKRELRNKINKLKRQKKTGSTGSGYVKKHGENKGKPIERKK